MTVKEELEIKKRSIIVDTEDEDDILVANEDDQTDDRNLSKKLEPEKEDPNSGIIYYLLDKHMWIFAIWLIPISIFYDIFWWCRARWTYWMCKSSIHRNHEEKV